MREYRYTIAITDGPRCPVILDMKVQMDGQTGEWVGKPR